MNRQTLRADIEIVIRERGITLHRLALESGVEPASLWRFLHKQEANLKTESLFRLWPIIYGKWPKPVTCRKRSKASPTTPPEGALPA